MINSTVDKVLEEVKTLTPAEQRLVHNLLSSFLRSETTCPQMTEDDFLQMLLQKRIISNIPNPDEDVAEDNDFEPIEVQGQPLSKTVIEERR